MPDESFTPPKVEEHEPITVVEPEAKDPATETTELAPVPAGNPHGRITGQVTTDLETGKIIQASYPKDGAATHK